MIWPEAVEAAAAFLRTAGIEARLEELPAKAADASEVVGAEGDALLSADGFACDGASVVALVPAGRVADPRKVAAAARCRIARPSPAPPFPFDRAVRVLVDHLVLAHERVWLPVGTPRHLLAAPPDQLARALRAVPADVVRAG